MPALPRFQTDRTPGVPTYGPAVGTIARLLGKPLLPWQQQLANVALEVSPAVAAGTAGPLDGHFRYPTVVALVPRRAGKSVLSFATMLQRLTLGPDLFAWYTAQTRTDAAATFRNSWLAMMRSGPWPGRVVTRESNGSESIRLTATNGLLGLFAPTPGGLHGSDSDLVIVDEAWAHKLDRGHDLEVAIRPTQLTRPMRQWWVISAAGTYESTWLASWIRKGRAGLDGVCYLEFSADPDTEDLDSPDTWARVHPGIGHTATLETLKAERGSNVDSLALFYRSYLNVTTEMAATDVLNPLDWRACRDEETAMTGEAVRLSFDVPPDRKRCAIALAGPAANGRIHLGLFTDAPIMQAGPVIRDLARTYRASIHADAAGPAGPLVDSLRNEGQQVHAPTVQEMARAAGALADDIATRRLSHSGQPLLDSAIAQATPRTVRDTWLFDRRTDGGHICTAGSLAYYAARRPAPLKPVLEVL